MINVEMIASKLNISVEELNQLLPYVLNDVRGYTNQYFLTKVHFKGTIIVASEYTIQVDDASMFKVGDWIEFLNSIDNTSIYSIKEIDGNTITVYQPLVTGTTTDTIIKLSFRGVSPLSLVGLLSYDLNRGTTKHIKSQSLSGGFSVSYVDDSTSSQSNTNYPIELMGGFNSLKKLNDDYQEYKRYGYCKKLYE